MLMITSLVAAGSPGILNLMSLPVEGSAVGGPGPSGFCDCLCRFKQLNLCISGPSLATGLPVSESRTTSQKPFKIATPGAETTAQDPASLPWHLRSFQNVDFVGGSSMSTFSLEGQGTRSKVSRSRRGLSSTKGSAPPPTVSVSSQTSRLSVIPRRILDTAESYFLTRVVKENFFPAAQESREWLKESLMKTGFDVLLLDGKFIFKLLHYCYTDLRSYAVVRILHVCKLLECSFQLAKNLNDSILSRCTAVSMPSTHIF
jgi:hypothetical protein